MNNKLNCPVCETLLENPYHPIGNLDGYLINCKKCGRFILSGIAEALLPTWLSEHKSQRPVLSHYIRRRIAGQKDPMISREQCLEQIEHGVLPSVFEQADNLLRLIGDLTDDPGQAISVDQIAVSSIIGAASYEGAEYCLKGLENSMLVEAKGKTIGGSFRHVQLTFSGWQRYDELSKGVSSGKNAFIAMKFGDSTLDLIVNDHFRNAVEQTGFNLVRLDDTPKAGLIDDRLRVEIKSARFLIADLTHENAGAYWEAGYAEGLGKPVIYTCERAKFEQDSSHFDTNHHLTVLWDHNEPEQAAKDLKATIRATLPEAIQAD